jgi:16S rRNA (uracil1498-N3)-methyltransferase
VSRPVFFVAPGVAASAVVGARVLLDGPEGRHAATVRRIGVGERVDVVDGAGRRLGCVVAGAARDALSLEVEELTDEVVEGARLVLVQALAKGDRDDQAIEAATELGVDGVVPWQAARSIVQWRGERGAKARQKWVDVVRSASKQSRRARVPEVAEVVDRRGLVARVQQAAATFVLHEEATEPLAAQGIPATGDVLVVVGPEGGIAPDELDALTAAGAVAVRLGHTVLRSSSAGPAALAVLNARSRWR